MSEISKYYDENNTDLIAAIKELGVMVNKPEQLISKIIKIVDLMLKE